MLRGGSISAKTRPLARADDWNVSDYIKTLLTLRAGEVRLVGAWEWWEPIEAGSVGLVVAGAGAAPGADGDLAFDLRFRRNVHSFQCAAVNWIFESEGEATPAPGGNKAYENAMFIQLRRVADNK